MIPLMKKQMEKLYGDVSWLVEKFDYRNKDADWGDSKEALQNCMQRLKGGFPADPAYKAKKQEMMFLLTVLIRMYGG
jgi:hypothetical protein